MGIKDVDFMVVFSIGMVSFAIIFSALFIYLTFIYNPQIRAEACESFNMTFKGSSSCIEITDNKAIFHNLVYFNNTWYLEENP